MFIPLYPKFPLFSVQNTYVAIRLDDIIVAIAILIWFIYQIKNKFPILKEKITWMFFAYFLAIFLSTVNALLIFQTVPKNILLLHFLRRIEYVSLFFLTITTLKNKKDLKAFYIFFVITALLVSAYGFGQKYLHLPVVSTMNSEFSKGQLLEMNVWTRISSTFAGHYDLAAYMTIALIIIGGIFLTSKNKFLKFLSLLIWFVCFQILNLTASRISTFAFWGGMTLSIILLKKYLWIIPLSVLMVLSIFNSKDLNQRLLATIPSFKTQIKTVKKITPTPTPAPIATTTVVPIPKPKVIIAKLSPTPTIIRYSKIEEFPTLDIDAGVARSGEIRFNAEWPRAITAFKRNPLLGSGLGSITLATDNDFLRLLGESGILGFITFMIIPLFFVIKTFKKPSTLAFIFLGALVATLANALFIDVLEASKVAYIFWIMMGIYYTVL
jgi:hypothetical protein